MTARPTRRKAGYTFTDVFKFASHYWTLQPGRFAVILALIALATFIESSLPTALSAFIESIRVHRVPAKIWAALGTFLTAYFSYTILYNIMWRVYNVFENVNFKRLLDDAFEHLEHLSEQYFVNTFTGSMITAIKRGRDRIESFEDVILLELTPTLLVCVNSIILLALRMPLLAAILLLYLIILIIGSMILVMKYAGPAQEAYANAQDHFGAHLADSITGIVTTKSYAQEKVEIARYVDETNSLYRFNLEAYLRGNETGLIQRLLMGGLLALLLGGGTLYYLSGHATIDDIAYLVMAHTILLSYVRNVGESVKRLMTSSYDLHAVIALLREQPAVADKPGAAELQVQKGEIRFNNVSFKYPNKPDNVFENLSITIRPGERIALVGDSGGGKTTFVRLVQRLYDVAEGSITIDGKLITDVTQASLRSAIAVVPQDPILFHRSIKDNIAYGRPEATMDEIRQAAKQANIDEFVMSLPEAYETLVGERGIKLSGGERQRVAIARAILADRKILILDEATSSLDSVSEQAIQSAIRTVTHGRTSIMIAHRLSTIRDADRILVFHNGRIVEEGTHGDLTDKADGIYASFYAIQSDGFLKN
jgi:ATP-binding cassette subfamily B protein